MLESLPTFRRLTSETKAHVRQFGPKWSFKLLHKSPWRALRLDGYIACRKRLEIDDWLPLLIHWVGFLFGDAGHD